MYTVSADPYLALLTEIAATKSTTAVKRKLDDSAPPARRTKKAEKAHSGSVPTNKDAQHVKHQGECDCHFIAEVARPHWSLKLYTDAPATRNTAFAKRARSTVQRARQANKAKQANLPATVKPKDVDHDEQREYRYQSNPRLASLTVSVHCTDTPATSGRTAAKRKRGAAAPPARPSRTKKAKYSHGPDVPTHSESDDEADQGNTEGLSLSF